MRRWNLILRVFMAEYLHLRPEEHSTLRRSDSELVSYFLLITFIVSDV